MVYSDPTLGKASVLLKNGASLEPKRLAHRIAGLLSDKKAEDVLLLDVSKLSAFADYFVIASGQTERQIEALLRSVSEGLKEENVKPISKEGTPNTGWVLVDYGDVVVHLFTPELRSFYDLEGLWHQATTVVHLQ